MADTFTFSNEYIFISYSSKNQEEAKKVCTLLEENGNRCFFAPRDIAPGHGYAGDIIKAIEKSNLVILIMTQHAVNSVQVLREINAAVSRGKKIIPLKYEEVTLNDDMQYYLGVSQWIDVRSQNIAECIPGLRNLIAQNVKEEDGNNRTFKYKGVNIKNVEELLNEGMPVSRIAMREIEIDYLCIPQEKYTMTEELEGSLDDWMHTIEHNEYETSACLLKNDTIIGYCDIYPVKPEAYRNLVEGKCIIREDMIDIYGFGGKFPAYIAMIAIIPEEEGHANYFAMFDWLFEHIAYWKKKHILLSSIAISVYSEMLESFIKKLDFHEVGRNPVGGKIYEIEYDELIRSKAVEYRYANLDLM